MEATAAVRALAEKEGVGTAFQEVACRRCRKFLLEIVILPQKAVARIKCKCGADNLIVIEPDRVTAVTPPS